MIRYALALAMVGVLSSGVQAQDTPPDLKGTWTGKGKAVVFGSNAHHPGRQGLTAAPRVRDIEVTYIVEGQDGPVAWGRASTAVADRREPFVWAMASDNKSIVGADVDGYYRITLVSPDRLEKCYVHNAARPSRSIVASCHMMDRVKKP